MQRSYTVAEINRYIKNMFTQDYLLGSVAVKGEVSNCTYHSSGHIYFTLKDKQSVLSCVMFAGNRAKGLSFALQEGMQVVVSGNVDTYERDGKYQLYARQITQDGLGELYERYELLKKELDDKGLFAKEHKKQIPHIVKRLGVVTAPTGAAIRDIISISKSRNPYIEIILYPALVQGADAAPSIVQGIEMLEAIGVDAMIVGRGGGSIEDLWAFNEEIVARAIYECEIPIISAVGHETDTTIADYVADVRAETPSAAAQIAVCEMSRIEEYIDDSADELLRCMKRIIENNRSRVMLTKARIEKNSPANKIKDMRYFSMKMEESMKKTMQMRLEADKYRLGLAAERLNGVSPLMKLGQGYSYTTDSKGKNVKSISDVHEGDGISIYVTDGKVEATVQSVQQIEYNK